MLLFLFCLVINIVFSRYVKLIFVKSNFIQMELTNDNSAFIFFLKIFINLDVFINL